MFGDRPRWQPSSQTILGCALFVSVLGCRADTAPVREPAAPPGTQAVQPGPSAPDWTGGAVFYGVYPPLFGEQPLRAVTEQIDELAGLGVDVLWLSPVMGTTDPNDFGYAVTDYLSVREDYGTSEDLRALVERAHEHDMRVIMDFVPNHTSNEHPWFHDPSKRDYYDRDAQGQPTHYFDWEHLPNLNYDNPEVVATMTAAMRHWVETYDIDGFRMDAAWGIQRRNPEVWPRLVRSLRQLAPDLYLVAEASAHDDYWVSNGFDAAYDWTRELGHWAWAGIFDDVTNIGPRLGAALRDGATPMHQVARFLNNNDTGERFVTKHGPELTRVAAALLLTLPGDAIVYTGDEVGAAYEPYEVAEPISWSDPHELRPHYERLAQLRESVPALSGDGFTLVRATPASTFAYLRSSATGGTPVLVVLNFGAPTRMTLTFDEARTLPAAMFDLLDRECVHVEQQGKVAAIDMPGTQSHLLVASPERCPA